MDQASGATIGEVVRQLRKDRRWSIRRLERESGVGRMTISKLEQNETTNYQRDTLDAIATAFNMTGLEIEALVQVTGRSLATVVRPVELPLEWVSFTRRVMHLDRHAHILFQSLLLFCEEHRRREEIPPSHHSSDGPLTPHPVGSLTQP
jgi:transcriptional regulator with XRE-family HTH domain